MIKLKETVQGTNGNSFISYEVYANNRRVYYTYDEVEAARVAIELKETGMTILPTGEFIDVTGERQQEITEDDLDF